MRISFALLGLFMLSFVLGGDDFSLCNFTYDESTVGGNFDLRFNTTMKSNCSYFVGGLGEGNFSSDDGFEHVLSRDFSGSGDNWEMEVSCWNGSDFSNESIEFTYVEVLGWNLYEPEDDYVEYDFFDLDFKTSRNAVCRWTLDEDYEKDFVYMDAFDETDGIRHKLDVEKVEAGRYTYYVGCEDEFGFLFYHNYDVKVDLVKPTVKVEAQSVEAGFYEEFKIEFQVEDDLDTRFCVLYSDIFGEFGKDGSSTKIEDGEASFFILKNVNFNESLYVFEIRCEDFVGRESTSGNRSLRVNGVEEDEGENNESEENNESVIYLEEDVEEVLGSSGITGNVVGWFDGFGGEFFGYFVLTVVGLGGFVLLNGNFFGRFFSRKGAKEFGGGKDFRRTDLIDLFANTLIQERKRKRLSRKRVARSVRVDVGDVKSLEDGVLPERNFDLIMRLEDFYGVNLRRYK